MSLTATIQIGNSDDKLTQMEWSEFVWQIQEVVKRESNAIFFHGGAPFNADWQNACWVCDIDNDPYKEMKRQIRRIRKSFRQDSVAVTIGSTAMV